MKLHAHLLVNEANLPPGTEWIDSSPGWKIVLVSKGFLYWLARSGARDLQPGDMLVIGPKVEGILRASQISAATLHFIYFRPEHLVGLISLSERHSLDAFAERAEIQLIRAGDPMSSEFGKIVANGSAASGFLFRARILQFIATILNSAVPNGITATGNVHPTRRRFDDIIAGVPSGDLIKYSPENLAAMCGCSLRHFRRLFYKRFGASVRSKQIELRLEKACQLLAETNEKVATIAVESGYRHLGLFNSMFKKRFGVTPTEWRRLHSPSALESQHANGHQN